MSGPFEAKRARGPVVLVTGVGGAVGARSAAAALACAGAGSDTAALAIDLQAESSPRPALLATAAARELEARLRARLPQAELASAGAICRLALTADRDGIDGLAAALPLARESVAVVHLPPALLRPVLEDPRVRASAALLRADLDESRALTALAAGDLIRAGLRVAVLGRRLGWLVAQAALLGALPSGAGLPPRLVDRLLREPARPSRTREGL